MPPGDRPLPSKAPAAEIEGLSRRVRCVATPPDAGRLSCVCTSDAACAAADWMHWSVWQDKQSRELWVRCAGGVAGVDVWFGPGDPSLAATLGAA